MKDLVELYDDAIKGHKVPPLVLLAAFNLDFLCIHPFCDGNGRVSRLLLLLECYRMGFEVGRYVSLERLIEQNKERYYETLGQSSQGWHEGKHAPWPYINYVLSILRTAYQEFGQRLGRIQSPRGEKTSLILHAVDTTFGSFSVAELRNRCPNVSVDMIRRVLKNLWAKAQVECLGRGQNARWQKTADWPLGTVETIGQRIGYQEIPPAIFLVEPPPHTATWSCDTECTTRTNRECDLTPVPVRRNRPDL